MAKSEGYVSAEYLRKAAELAAQFKRRSYELMHMPARATVLDVGCGPGMDTVPLAQRLGEGCRVVGIDMDEDMLAQANSYAKEQGVAHLITHQVGSAQRLEFADNTFDAVRAERLLQVLPASIAPQHVVAEMVRVCKPGGRVVLMDGDWASFSADFSDAELENRMMGYFAAKLRPNGYAGRQLYGLIKRAGLRDIDLEVFPFVVTEYDKVPVGDWLQGEARKNGVATEQEIARWREELQGKSERGEFFCAMNLMLVAGTKAD